MGSKRHKPEEIVAKLRHVEVVVGRRVARGDGRRDAGLLRLA